MPRFKSDYGYKIASSGKQAKDGIWKDLGGLNKKSHIRDLIK